MSKEINKKPGKLIIPLRSKKSIIFGTILFGIMFSPFTAALCWYVYHLILDLKGERQIITSITNGTFLDLVLILLLPCVLILVNTIPIYVIFLQTVPYRYTFDKPNKVFISEEKNLFKSKRFLLNLDTIKSMHMSLHEYNDGDTYSKLYFVLNNNEKYTLNALPEDQDSQTNYLNSTKDLSHAQICEIVNNFMAE